jgi:hypothetical protein
VILNKPANLLRIVLPVALLCLTACASGPQTRNSATLTGVAVSNTDGVAVVTFSADQLLGGSPAEVTVTLTRPAPKGGLAVNLKSSDTDVVALPRTLLVPAGQSSATAELSTATVVDPRNIAITAVYGETQAGTALNVLPATPGSFAVAVQRTSPTVAHGKSASAQVTTKIASQYNHFLRLSVSNLPRGVSVKLTPQRIPAPGAGTSTAIISVSPSAKAGTYSVQVKASDGTSTATATLTLQVAPQIPM